MLIHGVSHQQILIDQILVIDIEGGDSVAVNEEADSVIRYGDHEGLPEPLPGLETGSVIELQGI